MPPTPNQRLDPAVVRAKVSKRKDEFYRTKAWRHVRARVLESHQWECQACKSKGKLTRATMVHHELPFESHPELALIDYLPDGTRQLTPLCFECHEEIETKRGNRSAPAEYLTEEWW